MSEQSSSRGTPHGASTRLRMAWQAEISAATSMEDIVPPDDVNDDDDEGNDEDPFAQLRMELNDHDREMKAMLDAFKLEISRMVTSITNANTMPNMAISATSAMAISMTTRSSPTPMQSDLGDSLKLSDLAKELLKLIPHYDGTGGIQKFVEYATMVEDLVLHADVSAKMQFTLAMAKLTGDARLWWQEQCQTMPSENHIKSWETLCSKLRETYAPNEQANNIRAKLKSLKQT